MDTGPSWLRLDREWFEDRRRVALLLGVIVVIEVAALLVLAQSLGVVTLQDLGGSEDASAAITVLSVPTDDYRIAPHPNASDPGLFMPPATVRVDRVTGEPTLVYQLAIPELGHIGFTLYFITPVNEGAELTLDTTPSTVDREKLTEDTYRGRVIIGVRETNGTAVFFAENVTVPVVGVGG